MRKPTQKELTVRLEASMDLVESLRTSLYRTQTERDHAIKMAQVKVDTSMIDARIKLANALAQMAEAQARAIQYLIGKEVM